MSEKNVHKKENGESEPLKCTKFDEKKRDETKKNSKIRHVAVNQAWSSPSPMRSI